MDLLRASLTVSYNGSTWHGFAKQDNVALPTIQAELERAISTVFAIAVDAIELVCAGRTDAGVHATGQVISFNIPVDYEHRFNGHAGLLPRAVVDKLNGVLANSVVVRDFAIVDKSFSARFSALARTYRYSIANQASSPLVMTEYSWHIEDELDIEAMRQAADYLLGQHDFAAFCKSEAKVDRHTGEAKNTERTINSILFSEQFVYGEKLLNIDICGKAFLHNMVRIIVGALVEVGRSHKTPDWVGDLLRSQQRDPTVSLAPAKGLCLLEVCYNL